MKNFTVLLFCTLCLYACQPNSSSSSEQESTTESTTPSSETTFAIQLACENQTEDEVGPMSDLYLMVNDYKTKIGIIRGCSDLTEDQYDSYKVPSNAVTASYGYWAGYGEYFYATQDEENVHIYYGGMDEMSENPIAYRRIGTFSKGQYHIIETSE